ncbi:hypothetical protein FANTH_13378 [Fusarium anthophilum]|uniref:Uncharacterized protein n=1 Tax=Fusarium anthophilum TaxID=48485 RepID=A0A8H5DQ33_9HYPO|nr:hypothetical protein FANTH_13378 [Fusarium anthophilum]
MAHSDQDALKDAMYWKEKGEMYFHIDAYNFGNWLIRLLKDESTIIALAEMMKSYEQYRSHPSRVMAPSYANRLKYIEELFRQHDQRYLALFNDREDVIKLARKQKDAHTAGMLGTPGWQTKMRDADQSTIPKAKAKAVQELSVRFVINSDMPFTIFEQKLLKEIFYQFDYELALQIP